jgi:hypothetical protein
MDLPTSKITKKLTNSSYQKKDKSYQESLSNEEIKDKLKDYKRVDDIKDVPLNTHLRYFVIDKKTKKHSFRLGGFLVRKDEPDKYVILSNNDISWSVNTQTALFFRKQSNDDIRDEYEKKIEKLEKKIIKLEKELENIKK